MFGSSRVLGGLCFVCLNRLVPGLIHHIAHGQIVLGEFQRRPERRTHELACLFGNAAVPCSVTDNLARTHWEKLTWNIPFNGLGVAGAAGWDAATGGELPANGPLGPCLATEQLLANPKWKKLLRELSIEVIEAARALGLEVSETLADKHIERTGAMGAYKASTLLDFERGLPLELDSLFLEPLRQARKAKVPVPRLTALCRLLEAMEERCGRGRRRAKVTIGDAIHPNPRLRERGEGIPSRFAYCGNRRGTDLSKSAPYWFRIVVNGSRKDSCSKPHSIGRSSACALWPLLAHPLRSPRALAEVACVGTSKTSHIFCIRAIAGLLWHRRRLITQLFRFIRPAT